VARPHTLLECNVARGQYLNRLPRDSRAGTSTQALLRKGIQN
jgi:hypothetical protein